METSNIFISFLISFFLLSSGYIGSEASAIRHHRLRRQEKLDRNLRPTKLFVFGDSYGDTGNVRKSLGSSWKEPYGTTFPGKPAGRFSDGRILTDYIAKFLGLKSPLAYEWMKLGGEKVKLGLNFAYGGSGVFNTLGDILPNMSTQIGFLEKLMHDSVYSKRDLKSSVVLVCLAGNDYGAYLAQGGTMQGLQKFIPRVVKQLGANLERLRHLGANQVLVTSLEPLGCLPRTTVDSSYQQCNTSQMIGNLKLKRPLKPCCMGINGYSCGGVDEKGEKMYSVCSDPKSAFFWDNSHPTQAGWAAVYTTFKSSLEQFFKF